MVFMLCRAFLSLSSFENVMHAGYNAYDQYELAIPLAKAGDCMSALSAAMYGSGQLWRGFRSPALIRFISGEGLTQRCRRLIQNLIGAHITWGCNLGLHGSSCHDSTQNRSSCMEGVQSMLTQLKGACLQHVQH
jgi:hypothetical protein